MAKSKALSAAASFSLVVLLFGSLLVFNDTFKKERNLTILAGVVSSLIFLFSLTLYGNIVEFLGIEKMGWDGAVVSILVSSTAAHSVHLLATLVNLLLSFGWALVLSHYSQDYYTGEAKLKKTPVAQNALPKKRKH